MTNVLVVDDSEANRHLVAAYLNGLEFTLFNAGDVEEAVQQIEHQPPDIILTDLRMPGSSGLDLVSLVKQDYPLIPVILMTGYGSEDVAAEALKRGAASYVPKARLEEDLVDTVSRVLTASREDRQHSLLMHYACQQSTQFVIPNNSTVIESLVGYLQEMLRCLPLADENERVRVGLALEAALMNAYLHGNLEIGSRKNHADDEAYWNAVQERLLEAPYRDRQIHVSVDISRVQARYVIRDEGPGFDAATLLASAGKGGQRSGGRGLVLMRTIMDEVTFNDQGNQVVMIKRAAAQVDEVADQ